MAQRLAPSVKKKRRPQLARDKVKQPPTPRDDEPAQVAKGNNTRRPIRAVVLAPAAGQHRTLAPRTGEVAIVRRLSPTLPVGCGLSDQLIHALESLHLEHTFLSCIPSLVGANDAINSAAQAVTTAVEFHRTGHETRALVAKSHYTASISLLRESIGVSDASLAAVALLNVYESLMRATTGAQNLSAYFAHNQGMGAILLARPNDPSQISDMSRAVLYILWDRTFRVPCRLGIPSPFENTIWEHAEPLMGRGAKPLEAHVRTLRMLANKLFIRLPRLIMLVRSLREATPEAGDAVAFNENTAESALRIARELHDMADVAAETKFLHNVRVVKTNDEETRKLAPYSFVYESIYDMETGVLYWETRLVILKLCAVLGKMGIGLEDTGDEGVDQGNDGNDDKTLRPRGFSLAVLDAEQARMAKNIVMSWQYGTSFGAAGVHSMMNAMAIVWGSLPSVCAARNMPLEDARTWTLSHFHASLAGWPIRMSAADMDQTSGLFAGGPLDHGFLKNIYKAGRHRC